MRAWRRLSERRLRIGRGRRFPSGRLQLYIEPRDLWIGAFLAPTAAFLIAVPTLVVRWQRTPEVPAEPDPLDHAMFTVWREGNWRWITRRMTSEAREAAVAAVLRHDQWLKNAHGGETDEALTRTSLVWWE